MLRWFVSQMVPFLSPKGVTRPKKVVSLLAGFLAHDFSVVSAFPNLRDMAYLLCKFSGLVTHINHLQLRVQLRICRIQKVFSAPDSLLCFRLN